MTDLTEQWKKGELETNKYYYVRDISYILPAKLGRCDNQLYFSGNEVGYGYEENKELEVLAPVPSYEEYLSLTYAKEEDEGLIAEYEAENTKLKELLKECELWFTGFVGNMNDKSVGEHNRNLPIGNFEYAFKVFSQKINQALGEDK